MNISMRTTPAILAAVVMFLQSPAYAVDLTGAWATDATQCEKIFEKRGATMSFKMDSDLYGGGFIVDGSRIRGRMAKCEIKSRKEADGVLTLNAVCASDIMFQNAQFSVKVIDDNRIVRLFTDIPDMELSYQRCVF